jgi:hypothetical protein
MLTANTTALAWLQLAKLQAFLLLILIYSPQILSGGQCGM